MQKGPYCSKAEKLKNKFLKNWTQKFPKKEKIERKKNCEEARGKQKRGLKKKKMCQISKLMVNIPESDAK